MSEKSCVQESVLCRRRSPRVCRDVELAGVFWFRRDFPRGTGDGEVGGGFPDGDDLRGKRARAGTAQPGAPPSLRSLFPLRVCDENGAAVLSGDKRMNRDRSVCVRVAYAPRCRAADVCPSVTVAITELWSYRVTKSQNTAAEAHQIEKMESYFREIVTNVLHGYSTQL